jgi:hypothetical protein
MLLGVPVARYFIHDVLGVPFRDHGAAAEQPATAVAQTVMSGSGTT